MIRKISDLQRKYYHGSYDKLPVGTILTPRGDTYEKDWQKWSGEKKSCLRKLKIISM